MGALKKSTCKPEVKPETKPSLKIVTNNQDNEVSKAEIERMKKLITEKIKDPELAKKAALIINEMLNK